MTTATLPVRHKTLPCWLHYSKVNADINLASISETFSYLPDATILGGNPAKANADGFSYWAAKPKEIFEFRATEIKPFEKLQRALDKYRLAETQNDLPKEMFTAGWMGYFGYELGGYIERLPEPPLDDLKLCDDAKLEEFSKALKEFTSFPPDAGILLHLGQGSEAIGIGFPQCMQYLFCLFPH